MRKNVFVAVVVLSMAVFATAAGAYEFKVGDVFASTGSGTVQVYSQATGYTLATTLNTTKGGFTTGSATDSAGNFYVTNFSSNNITRFDKNGVIISPNPFVTSGIGTGSNESIVFDKVGNFYVGHADGNQDIEKYDSAGNRLASYDVTRGPRGSDWIDLASDQKTMYYTSEGRYIYRYDVSTGTQLSNFADLGGGVAFALRILGDGGILVADQGDIKLLNSTGGLVRSYDVTGENSWFALNLDPDGTTFWSGNYVSGNFYAFDIATGTLLKTISTGAYNNLYGLSVYGEITQSGGGVGGKVPEPGTMMLLGSGLVGLVGISRKRFLK